MRFLAEWAFTGLLLIVGYGLLTFPAYVYFRSSDSRHLPLKDAHELLLLPLLVYLVLIGVEDRQGLNTPLAGMVIAVMPIVFFAVLVRWPFFARYRRVMQGITASIAVLVWWYYPIGTIRLF